MNRKICVVTGTRAEYGLLRTVMRAIKIDDELTLQTIATGMHLSPEFGLTFREIELDGFDIDRAVEMLMSSDTPVGIAKSMGLGMISYSEAFAQLKPDIILVLGDRFEIFSAVAAALIARIPVAHIHGGESTEGLIDEAIRHSITKMSHLHFVAAKQYGDRVIQLGEDPKNVFLVGGLGIDCIKEVKLLSRSELESALGIRFGKKNLLITFHPVTLEDGTSKSQMEALLAVLDELKDTELIFTMPNADTNGRIVMDLVERFGASHSNAHVFDSLGQQKYFSCLAQVDAVVGNSSSGILEAPSFKKGVVNIGDRQKGRLRPGNVIDCEPTIQGIKKALDILYSNNFQKKLDEVENPFDAGGACKKIIKILKSADLTNALKKQFFCIDRL